MARGGGGCLDIQNIPLGFATGCGCDVRNVPKLFTHPEQSEYFKTESFNVQQY